MCRTRPPRTGKGRANVQIEWVAPKWRPIAVNGHDCVLLWCLVLSLLIYRSEVALHSENERAGRCAQAFIQGVVMAIRLSREERAASSNRGATQLPPLSPAFLHEADAAYWAHQEIGQRRDVEYGGGRDVCPGSARL